ncbi:DUF6549 family protein [Pontibacter kalidii]|uniref:DUF6549 family protein n=1 Tax=Pontibacter kalidii TaxID=2592049 RepID=UPI00225860D7|nr:DUF6549 family protein [Pontibacter kalidii]
MNLLVKLENLIQSGSKLLLLLFVLLIIALSSLVTRCSVEKTMEQNQKAVYKVLSTEIQRHKDKAGAEVAKRQALELERREFLSMLADKDSNIHRLQEVVRKAGAKVSSATVATVQTDITASAPAQLVVLYLPDSTKTVTYTGHINTDWVSGRVQAGPDSVRLEQLRIRNEFEIWQQEERAGLFKPLQPVVYFRSLNPHSTVTDFQSYVVKPKAQPKVVRILKGIVLGLAVYGAVDLALK